MYYPDAIHVALPEEVGGHTKVLIDYMIVMRNKSSELLDYIELGFDSISLKCLKNMKTVYQDENNVVLDENSFE